MNYPRTNYVMSEAQEKRLLKACVSMPVIMIGNSIGLSQQERANDAWAELGKEMGFDSDSVEPRQGYGQRHFTAVPSETPEQQAERKKNEQNAAREKEVNEIDARIHTLTIRRNALFS